MASAFRTATLVFLDPLQASLFDGVLGDKERWRTIGKAGERYLLVVAHTVTEDGEEVIRILLAREATPHERRKYEDEL